MEAGLAVRSSVQSTSSAGSRRSQSPADRVRFRWRMREVKQLEFLY